jgi:hypothetical protein
MSSLWPSSQLSPLSSLSSCRWVSKVTGYRLDGEFRFPVGALEFLPSWLCPEELKVRLPNDNQWLIWSSQAVDPDAKSNDSETVHVSIMKGMMWCVGRFINMYRSIEFQLHCRVSTYESPAGRVSHLPFLKLRQKSLCWWVRHDIFFFSLIVQIC